MKTIQFFSLLAVVLALYSCGDDDSISNAPIDSETVSNLFAPATSTPNTTGPPIDGGPFTKFDFATGEVTTSETEWDVAFRATAIIVNGGESQGTDDEPERTGNAAAYVAVNDFANVNSVNLTEFRQDSQDELAIIRESDLGWYNYSGPPIPGNPESNIISPLPGRTLVFRTRDGRYAKVRILSYYRNNPDDLTELTEEQKATDARYYTFEYVYQPNEGVTTFN